MCKAIEDIRLEGYEEGYEEGLKEGIKGAVDLLRSVGISEDDIVKKMVDIYDLSKESAEQYMAVVAV